MHMTDDKSYQGIEAQSMPRHDCPRMQVSENTKILCERESAVFFSFLLELGRWW